MYQKRLGSGNAGFTASPVAADGKLYFTSEEGVIHIVAAGPDFKQVASNEMGAFCMATPAISGGLLIVRSTNHVFAIGHPPVGLVSVNQSRTSGRMLPRLQRLRARRCRRAH
jgi:hypothetical protein